MYFFSFPDLAFGSIITLKNARAGGALLHSHTHLYPKEHPPEQQQVNVFAKCNFIHPYIVNPSLSHQILNLLIVCMCFYWFKVAYEPRGPHSWSISLQ